MSMSAIKPPATSLSVAPARGDAADWASEMLRSREASSTETLIAGGGYRPTRLTTEQRFLPADQQDRLLRNMGYVPVGDFTMRLSPDFYGVPVGKILETVDRYRAILSVGGPVNQAVNKAILTPMLEQAKANAPILAEFNGQLPQGFVNATRSGRFETEAVFRGANSGADGAGAYVDVNSRVYIRKTGY